MVNVSSTTREHGLPRSLVGRDRECTQLSHLVEQVREGTSQVLVLRGEAGIGKTALLDFVKDQASGCVVVEAAGMESEMELAYAGLHQLCVPMLDHLDLIPARQREALDTVFGVTSGDQTPDRFLVGLAVLSLLSESARHHPIICVIDDVQWLDEASLRTLSFVARRLQAEAVGVVFAERGSAAEPELRSLPQLNIEGLSDQDARTLLASALPGPLDRRVRDRIVAETGGNPLALLQLPRSLTPEQAAGGFGFSGTGALTRQLEESFHHRLTPMPAATRRLLVVAAAEPGQDAALIWQAAARLGVTMQDAEPAVADGFVHLAGLVRFCHPLARSTVYKTALAEERRAAHRALADATDPDKDPERRAWHRAQATAGLDEAVAAELERSAGLAQARGGQAASAAFFERAAELTPDPRRRAERALVAARSKFDAGSPERALRLLAIAQAGPSDDRSDALIALLHAQILTRLEPGRGSPLLDAASRLEAIDPALARETYRDAFYAAQIAGRLGQDGGTFDVAAATRIAAGVRQPENTYDLLLDGVALTAAEGYAAGAPMLRDALAAFRRNELSSEASYPWLAFGSLVALSVWDEHAADELSSRLITLARDRGALSILPTALMLGVGYQIFAGDLSLAATLAEECDLIREATTIPKPPYGLLMVAASRGLGQRVTSIIENEHHEATERGEGQWLTAAGWAEALVNNGLGRYDLALAAAERATEPPNEMALVNWARLELIEAAARSGQEERASHAMGLLEEMSQACQTDGFMAYLTNEALTVELAGYEITNLAYADNGVPYVAETFSVTDQYLAENKELLKAFLIAEIKGWTDVFQESTDDTVSLIEEYYNQAAAESEDGLEAVFGALDPVKTGKGLEAEKLLISTDETEANGLFTISDDLKKQTVASLAAAGWDVSVEDLFDTTIIDEIYEENPELKDYLP